MHELFDGKNYCSMIEYIDDNFKSHNGYIHVTDFISNIRIFKEGEHE